MEIQKYFTSHEIIRLIQTYRNQFLTGAIVITVLLGGLVYWRYNQIYLEKNAQQALSELLTEYNQAYDNSELWQDIEIGARTGYRQYAQSSLAPYFIGIQVESLTQQDKFDEALLLMRTMMKKISTTSPMYDSFAIKWARMKLSSSDKANQEEGLQNLIQFANNDKNPQQEQAQYYLALYYDNNDQRQKARELWKNLAQEQKDAQEVSPWVMLAQQQIA